MVMEPEPPKNSEASTVSHTEPFHSSTLSVPAGVPASLKPDTERDSALDDTNTGAVAVMSPSNTTFFHEAIH
jgi:hypothetical protein